MKSIYSAETLKEIVSRIDKLSPDSKALWGKMNVSQMMAHCVEPLKVSTGKTNEPRLFIGRILAPFLKKGYYNDKPWPKNSPTAPSYIMSDVEILKKKKPI